MQMKFVIIGPTWPYKGGITHYNCWLGNTLKSKGNEVIGISFKQLYPKLLFPGKNQKDTSQENRFEFDIHCDLRSLNYFNWIKAVEKIKALKPDVIIFHWWTPFFSPLMRYISRKITCNKLCICHNVIPHKRTKIDKILTKYALKNFDNFIVHGENEKEKLIGILPKIDTRAIKATPHPSYAIQFKINNINRNDAREKLNLKGRVILFFGFVREYKGLTYLIQALPMINQEFKDITLLIVGEFWEDKKKYIRLIENLKLNNIRIVDSYVSDDLVEIYIKSSDIVVIPYTSGTSSGVVQIAFGFNIPVIVTNVGVLEEIVENKKTGYIIPPKDPKAIANAISEYYNKNDKDELTKAIKKTAYRFSWERLVETLVSFYE